MTEPATGPAEKTPRTRPRPLIRIHHVVAALAVALIAGSVSWIASGGLERADREWLERVVATWKPSEGRRAALDADIRAAGFDLEAPAYIRIFKHESQLEVWLERDGRYRLFRTWPICRWSGELGPKLAQGDRQAPEGFYRVTRGQLNPNSAYHLSFNLGYPNGYDRFYDRTGSFLMVHGGCSSAGCYAMTDVGVDDIYRIVERALAGGQEAVPVHIFPFRMTRWKRATIGRSHLRWREFWDELQPGYDAFEATHLPPDVRVEDGRYVVEAGELLTQR